MNDRDIAAFRAWWIDYRGFDDPHDGAALDAWQAALAHARQQSGDYVRAPKEIFVVIDDEGQPDHAATWEGACHEHINDAINEHRLDGAEKWVVRRYVVAAPAQQGEI